MKRWLFDRYERARLAGLPQGVDRFPPIAQRYFSNVSGFEPAEFVRRLLATGGQPTVQSILIVGVGAGRDTFWLELHGYRTVSIDIAAQADIPRLLLSDMAALPFDSGAFDAVVVADALEHTFFDHAALLEFRRVLRPRGSLILNIPFGDDVGEEHVRVYSERTLARLLKGTGFAIEQKVYRGVMPLLEQRLPGFQAAFHGIGLLAFLVGAPSPYLPLLEHMLNFDWRHGSRAGLRKFSQGHGAYVRASVVPEVVDYRALNRASYEQQAAAIGHSYLRRQKASGC